MELCKFTACSVACRFASQRSLHADGPVTLPQLSPCWGQLPACSAWGLPRRLTLILQPKEPRHRHQDNQRQFGFTLNQKAHSQEKNTNTGEDDFWLPPLRFTPKSCSSKGGRCPAGAATRPSQALAGRAANRSIARMLPPGAHSSSLLLSKGHVQPQESLTHATAVGFLSPRCR